MVGGCSFARKGSGQAGKALNATRKTWETYVACRQEHDRADQG